MISGVVSQVSGAGVYTGYGGIPHDWKIVGTSSMRPEGVLNPTWPSGRSIPFSCLK